MKTYTNQLLQTFEKRKRDSSFIDNIWGADLAYMQLITNFNKGIRLLLCVVDVCSKYAWNVSLKNKKGITITEKWAIKSGKICVSNDKNKYHRTIKMKPVDVKSST